MYRLDQKLARIRAGQYTRNDFIIADAKDGDMGPSMTSCGPKREKDGSWSRHYTRPEFLDNIRAVVEQDIVDIMLTSASNMEALTDMGVFRNSAVKAGDPRQRYDGCMGLPRGHVFETAVPAFPDSASLSAGCDRYGRSGTGRPDHRHGSWPLFHHLQQRPRPRLPGAGGVPRLPRRCGAQQFQVLP